MVEMAEAKGTHAEQNKESGQRPPRESEPWTLRKFGGKTVWDWMSLLVVPLVVALSAASLGLLQGWIQQRADDQRARDVALQAYLDQMGQLVLNHNLDEKQPSDEAAQLARARTLTVLGILDTESG
jgi:hypothetical protein